ncbi:MAG: adenine deaminase [Clostridia bacterium]
MKTLLKNGMVVNVFTGEIEKADILLADEKIIGVGDYSGEKADRIRDVEGKYICPGFIDGHIHIESTMLLPGEFARTAVLHGTTAVIADPHEIANVCGTAGIQYMLEASEGVPLTVYVTLPSCVPATHFDESGAVLNAGDLEPFYGHPRVIGLGEVMDYPGVIAGNPDLLEKIAGAVRHDAVINGHAPLLSGKDLDRYLSFGIYDDHECSSAEEAKERIRKGQRVMIRQGTAARNLEALLPLFDAPWAHRCLLVSDDKHPADLLNNGHIDDIIRQAVRVGKNPVTGIQMATVQAAEHFGLRGRGAVAPGYIADLIILDDLEEVTVEDVYCKGVLVVENRQIPEWHTPEVCGELENKVRNSFYLEELSDKDFRIYCDTVKTCRVIKLVKNEILTEEWITDINFHKNNGIDADRDILKIAVVERHSNTGHIGLGLISGTGMKQGAIASSVSHDSHNLIVIGTNEKDMAEAANRIRELGGGCIVVNHGEIVAEMPLPIAGLMTDRSAPVIAGENERLRESVYTLGVPRDVEPFMTMAFVSLPVIPHLKLTTKGLVDVDRQCLVSLFAEEE